MTRLVAVLGYSDGTTHELHPTCAARLARAAVEIEPDDVVLFSGWARSRAPVAEAALMARHWETPVRVRLLDRGSRTTLGNVRAVVRAAQRTGADEIVLVTSRWHARRASTLARAALARSGTRLRVAVSDEPRGSRQTLREAAAWVLVPLLALLAVRNR